MYKCKRKIMRLKTYKPTQEQLQAQKQLSKEVKNYVFNIRDKKYFNDLIGHNHAHICTYEMLSNDKHWQNAQCCKMREKIRQQFDIEKYYKEHYEYDVVDRYDYCDFCPMMNYVLMDADDEIIFTTHCTMNEILNKIGE